MRRLALFALSVAAAGSVATAALAQTYASALPLTAAERRALESRLSTILDYAQENQVARIQLPGGGEAAVRPYRLVRTPEGRLCRGYRIDVDGQAGRSAVDGYRCRTREGQAWVIAQPETTIQQNGPLDLRRPTAPPVVGNEAPQPGSFADRMRARLGQPAIPLDPDAYAEAERRAAEDQNVSLFGPGEVPPIPREAPARVATTAVGDDAGAASAPEAPDSADSQSDTAGADVMAPSARTAPGGDSGTVRGVTADAPVPADRGETAEEPSADGATELARGSPATSSAPRDTAADASPDSGAPSARAALDQDSDTVPAPDAQPRMVTPRPADSGGASGADVAAVDGARVVSSRPEDTPATDATDTRVVAALKELHYLPPSASEADGAVEAAIDDFARDERFALPVPSADLLARLNDALDRSGSLPVCETNTQTMCIAP